MAVKHFSLVITLFVVGCSSSSDLQEEANKICNCYDRIHYANSAEHPFLIDSCNALLKNKLSELDDKQKQTFDIARKKCPH